MPDKSQPNTSVESDVHARLRDAARVARESKSLEPEVRVALAELLEELSRTAEAPGPTPAAVAHLAESAAHLAEALHHKERDHGALSQARDRLGDLLARAESHAPTAVGLARRLTDALAAIGV